MNPIPSDLVEELIKQSASVWLIVQFLKSIVEMNVRQTQGVAFTVALAIVCAVAWPIVWSPGMVYALLLAAVTIAAAPVVGHKHLEGRVGLVDALNASRRRTGKLVWKKEKSQ